MLDDLGGAQGLTTLNDKYKPQTTPEEHAKRCTEMTEAIKMLRKYNKECYSSLTQQVLSALLRTRSQMTETRCKDPNSAEFKESVEASKCIAEQALSIAQTAEKRVILTLQALYDANIPDDKLRTRHACCAINNSKKAFLGAIKTKCAMHEKLYAEYFDSYTSEAMGLICPEADKLECNTLEPIKIDGLALKSKFFLNPMIKLVKTLDH